MTPGEEPVGLGEAVQAGTGHRHSEYRWWNTLEEIKEKMGDFETRGLKGKAFLKKFFYYFLTGKALFKEQRLGIMRFWSAMLSAKKKGACK